jgi:hypothetical protein
MKAGAGIRMNYLLNGYAIYADADGVYTYVGGRGYITSWLTSVNFKLGYVEDLGKRLQLQICPNLFCTPNSMFKKYSILGQRSVGAGLEFLLLYKFN